MKPIKAIFGLLALVGGLALSSVSHAQAQDPDTTLTFTPRLWVGDSSGNQLAAPEGNYTIPYADKDDPVRVYLEVLIEQSGAGNSIQPSLEFLGNRRGVKRMTAGLRFVPTGTASSTDAVRLLGGSETGAMFGWQGFDDASRETSLASNGNAATVQIFTEAGHLQLDYPFDISTGDNFFTNSGLKGAWCFLEGGATSCVVSLGYTEITPSLPVGGSIRVDLGGYHDFEMDGVDLEGLDLQNSPAAESVFNTPLSVTFTQDYQSLVLRGEDVTILEGGAGATFTVAVDPEAPLAAAAVVTLATDLSGANPASPGDFSIDPSGGMNVTIAEGETSTVFTISALEDTEASDSPVETVDVYLTINSGGIMPTSATYTVSILNVTPLPEGGSPIMNTIPDGETLAFSVRPEGTAKVENNTGDTVEISQDTSTDPVVDPVILEITNADGEAGDFVGATISIPVTVFDDGDSASDMGRTIVTRLAAGDAIVHATPLDTDAPFGNTLPRDGTLVPIDIVVEVHDDDLMPPLGADVEVCLPYDDTEEGDPGLFRYDEAASEWVAMGESANTSESLVCGTSAEFSLIAVFYASTAVPDLNQDEDVNDQDALILYYSFALLNVLGVGR